MGYAAKIHADSKANGSRLVTFEVTIPRMVLAEFNTHRMFSRNSASSRAIPVKKMIRMVMEDPYIPDTWGKNQKGMQADEDFDSQTARDCELTWLLARDQAVMSAKRMGEIGVHKQITNRLLEPFMWHTVIVTATEWSNFFHLRNNPMAHPAIQIPARMMQGLYESHEPELLDVGEWHLPMIGPADYDAAFESGLANRAVANGDSRLLMELMVKVSTARCARVSYLTHDGKRDLKVDIQLHDRLLESGHMSPFEHAATPIYRSDGGEAADTFLGNFRGWEQYRKTIPGEADIMAPR